MWEKLREDERKIGKLKREREAKEGRRREKVEKGKVEKLEGKVELKNVDY